MLVPRLVSEMVEAILARQDNSRMIGIVLAEAEPVGEEIEGMIRLEMAVIKDTVGVDVVTNQLSSMISFPGLGV